MQPSDHRSTKPPPPKQTQFNSSNPQTKHCCPTAIYVITPQFRHTVHKYSPVGACPCSSLTLLTPRLSKPNPITLQVSKNLFTTSPLLFFLSHHTCKTKKNKKVNHKIIIHYILTFILHPPPPFPNLSYPTPLKQIPLFFFFFIFVNHKQEGQPTSLPPHPRRNNHNCRLTNYSSLPFNQGTNLCTRSIKPSQKKDTREEEEKTKNQQPPKQTSPGYY
ncbi:hypothetical protein QBC41DRAFT_312104 [Cercophora samala]|uniref:Uncharacterized protein n=1 Tax=Cercophora samala TaxID=330535 RepID=A0AA40DFQ5_9PEZI|nr:hypothetical protein QBC41DRAFT_312104 [Cercophora samala]